MATPPNRFDQACRYLVRRNAETLLGWLLGLPASAFAFEGWLDTRTLTFPGQPDRTRDTVAFVRDLARGGVPWAVVLEFQLEPDAEMFGRLLVYVGHLWLELRPSEERGDRFEVGAVIVNLTGRGRTARASEWPEVGLALGLRPRERNLADEDAAATLAAVESGAVPRAALPFVPLMTGGAEAGIIEGWLRLASAEPDGRRRGDLGGLAEVFAEAAGCRAVWKEALKGWNMIESQVVQEWQAEARAEGRAESKAESVLEALEARFGPVPADLTGRVRATTDLAELKRWLVLAVQAPALDQFRQQAGL